MVVFAAAVLQEWSNKTTPQPPLSAAASQVPALAASPPIPPAEIQQAQSANSAPPQQKVTPPSSGWDWDAEDTIAVFTGLTFFVFMGQLWQMSRTNQHFRVTERAYVKMSHFSPGVSFVQNMGAPHAILAIRVRNFGHTPAHVTDVYVGSLITSAGEGLLHPPEYPSIEGREIGAAFLVADDEFIHRVDFGLTHADHTAVINGAADLYIIGYVDYRDKFGQIHRGAYARIYDPGIDEPPANVAGLEAFENRNNLTIVSEPRYNDDFPIG